MRPRPLLLLLAASLAANAAFLGHALLRDRGAGDRDGLSLARAGAGGGARSGFPTTAGPDAGAGDVIADGDALIAAFRDDDLATLRDQLRAIGVPEERVRSIVSTGVWNRFSARMKALQSATDDASRQVWWKDVHQLRNRNQSPEQRAEARRLQSEAREEIERLLGPDNTTEHYFPQNPRLAGLPPEKVSAIQQIDRDYGELMGEIHQEAQGFQLPSDREKLRFLQEEKERDLMALLSPEELRQYQLRTSPTAQQLRWRMTQMDATEEEFIAIFDLQKSFDERFSTHDPFGGSMPRDQEFWKQRQEAERELKQQIRDALGEERYLDYARSQDHNYQQLQAATRRLNLPPDTPARIYALRDTYPAAASQVADDSSLSNTEKRAALRALAGEARRQAADTLGPEATEALVQSDLFRWIDELEKGNIITFTEDGGQKHRHIPADPKPKK